MSGAAIIGSAAIGAGVSMSSASKASKSSSAALASADAASQLQYEVSMEQKKKKKTQYANWENIFGPIQQNLSNYYKNINPDTIASSGLQNIEQSYTQSRQNLDQQLAKRGISNSGAAAAGLTQLETARMLGKAEVNTNAPMIAAQQQSNFLAGGLGQQSQLQSGISNTYSNQMNMFGQQALNKQNMSNQYANQAAQAYSGIGSSIGSGINTYMTANAIQNMNPGSNYVANPASYGATTGFWG